MATIFCSSPYKYFLMASKKKLSKVIILGDSA